MDEIKVTAKKNFLRLIRRVKYSAAFVGLFSHSAFHQIFFERATRDVDDLTLYVVSDVKAVALSSLLCIALIETGMWVLDRRMK